jgi:hypothetical protein
MVRLTVVRLEYSANVASFNKTESHQGGHRCCGGRLPNSPCFLLCASRLVPSAHEGNDVVQVSANLHTDPAIQHIRKMDHPLRASEPFLLVGLLANYDKFETQNQYRVRLADYVDDNGMEKVIESIGWTCKLLQDRYIAILDDSPAVWSIGGTLSYVGLGALARTKAPAPVLSEDEQRTLFSEQ